MNETRRTTIGIIGHHHASWQQLSRGYCTI
jgi:hypothetical protein